MKKNKLEFTQYEYDRLLFLNDITKDNKFFFLYDNINFLKSVNKFDNLSTIFNAENDIELIKRNIDFLSIFTGFIGKFKYLYGYNVKNSSDKKMMEDLYFVYLPLSRYLHKKCELNFEKENTGVSKHKPIICGIQAHQGCGKTTLTNILKYILNNIYSEHSEILSIDDLYLTHKELIDLKLRNKQFKYRGPPGTHDLKLTINTLENIKNSKISYLLPRYNKAANKGLGDRTIGKPIYIPIDILLFDGWFLGTDPVKEDELINKDKNKLEFQKLINLKLKEYQKVWEYVDYWVILRPKRYEYSRIWRWQAERKNKQGMRYNQMQEFLDYFWLSIPPYLYFTKLEKLRKPILLIELDKYRNYYI